MLILLKAWIAHDPASRSEHAYCKLCRQVLRAHKTDLLRHKKTKKHEDLAKSLAKQPKLSNNNELILSCLNSLYFLNQYSHFIDFQLV